MQNSNCIFCDIINGQVQASKVYEDDTVIAIMDVRQAMPGHVLVIPKEHCPNIYSLTNETGFAIMECLIQVSKAVNAAFDAEGLSVWQSNGPAANQEIDHVHFHIHPRKMDDGLLRVYPQKPQYPNWSVLNDYAQQIKSHLHNADNEGHRNESQPAAAS